NYVLKCWECDMMYKYFGFFLAAFLVIFVAICSWIYVIYQQEKELLTELKKLNTNKSEVE
ncbi:MAG: hypothetical protein QGH17_06510, partial [Candidatus Marinimicrobia bacterium]|nr:hypothetical protein [Candidatus Neomarinimicrobiota bacterium]